MSKRARAEEEEEEEKEEDGEEEEEEEEDCARDYEQLGNDLVDAAIHGALDWAKAEIEAGADVHFVDDSGLTPMMAACLAEGLEDALAVVIYLVEECRANLRIASNDGWTCLHYAALQSSVEVVQYLLQKAPMLANARNLKGCTALFQACMRQCQAGIDIVQVLLDAGADLSISDDSNCQALHFACTCSSPEVVRLLLSHGADVNGAGSISAPIFNAIGNRDHGAAIVALLIENGADLTLRRKDMSLCRYAFSYGSPAVIATLVRLRPDLATIRLVLRPDEIRKWTFVGQVSEARPWKYDSVTPANVSGPADDVWCAMRAKKNVVSSDIVGTLEQSADPDVWKIVLDDLWIHFGCETILHKAIKSDKLSIADRMTVLEDIGRVYVNPFALDEAGRMAMSYIDPKKEPEAFGFLAQYQAWSPCKEKTRWFGPLFKQRALTLLLCLRQIGFYQKDIKGLLVRYLARTEYVYA